MDRRAFRTRSRALARQRSPANAVYDIMLGRRVRANRDNGGRDLDLDCGAFLLRRGGSYVVADGHARTRIVTLGHRNDATAELRGGIRRGECIVLQPGDRLRGGARRDVARRAKRVGRVLTAPPRPSRRLPASARPSRGRARAGARMPCWRRRRATPMCGAEERRPSRWQS